MVSSAMSASTMAFSTNNLATNLYSSSWAPTTTSGYVGTWFFLFILAVTWRGLVRGLKRLDAYYVRKHESHLILIHGGLDQATRRNTVLAWRLSVNLPRAALAMVAQGVAYLLMIAVMTMNVGFFFAVIVGYFFGEAFFGRVAQSPF
ncbi:MAG: hypothetical protein M1838_001814 [Thelocarpon superellum]|nr:MAG: hypothetical protein M1838_001814 [Thelocarpon superellum]